jgi:hypothetical protein
MLEVFEKQKRMGSVRELKVYVMAFETAMRIFQLTKGFPVEERFAFKNVS